jgi:hypothetical protein
VGKITDFCDAVANDLETNAGLPTHQKWLYLTPPVIRSDVGPTLCVYVKDTDFDLLQTEQEYQDTHTLTVEWWESATRAVDAGGTGGQELALAALNRSEAIIDRLRGYAIGVPNVTGQSEGTLLSSQYGLTEGMAWLCRIELQVSRWN